MKLLIILAVAAVAVAEYYDSKYDNYNIDELVGNERLLTSFTSCFLESGKCSNDAAEFKKWIPEAVQTTCAKCTEKQKGFVAKYLKVVKEKLAVQYNSLCTKYSVQEKQAEEFISKYA